MKIESISFKDIKCFKDKVTLENPSLFNLLIGKNNAGKSTVLEPLADLFSNDKSEDELYRPNQVTYNIILDAQLLETIYPEEDNKELKDYLLNKSVNVTIYSKDSFFIRRNFRDPACEIIGEESPSYVSISGIKYKVNLKLLAKGIDSIFPVGHVDYLSAERDIKDEDDPTSDCDFSRDGSGITNWLNARLNHAKYRDKRIRSTILKYLNSIFSNETSFTNIQVLKNDDGKWGIYLTENDIDIPISEMGSGVKAILTAIVFIVRCLIDKENTIFLFEELENNLHPDLFRNLLQFIYNFSVENNVPVYITSHSSIAIDFFYDEPQTAIYHVIRKNGVSNIIKIDKTDKRINILKDLGVKPSDILLSNGIIWVEGPSDRIYINKWIHLINENLKENKDYSFMYYGGRNLSHYTLDDVDEFISILKTNHNSAIVMDSDKTSENDSINNTKKRILEEFDEKKMFSWITAGKEIENYLSKKDINKLPLFKEENGKKLKISDHNDLPQVNRYEEFSNYIKDVEPRFENMKVQFSKSIDMDSDSLDVLDLSTKVKELINVILEWNHLPLKPDK